MHPDNSAISRLVKATGQLAQLTSPAVRLVTAAFWAILVSVTLLVMGFHRHAALVLREVIR